MGIKRIFKHYLLGKSIKEIEMDKILDKISKKVELSDRESKFLDLYYQTKFDNKDFLLLSKVMAFKKVKYFLSISKKVICDLKDRDGKIGMPILNAEYDSIYDSYRIFIKNRTIKLHDRYLYNLIYNFKRNEYSLQEHDEYFEKIEAI